MQPNAGQYVTYVDKADDRESFRFRLPGQLKEEWVRMCLTKKISQQEAIEAVIGFLLAQDDTTRSMLLGQIAATDDLIELVLRRIRDSRRSKRPKNPIVEVVR